MGHSRVAIFENMMEIEETKCSYLKRFLAESTLSNDAFFPSNKQQMSPPLSRNVTSPSEFKIRMMEMLYFEDHGRQNNL
eukprot:scaffold4770_cov177-Amphora_coffeaeformis.AAC.3